MYFTENEKEMAKRNIKQFCSKWDELNYDEVHFKPYFIGKRKQDSPKETLFPIHAYKEMSFKELKNVLVDSGSDDVTLAVYGSDSTVVTYKAHMGLKPPKGLEGKVPSPISEEELIQLRESMCKNTSIASGSIERAGTSSTDDCLQIDLLSDSESEKSTTAGKNERKKETIEIDLMSDNECETNERKIETTEIDLLSDNEYETNERKRITIEIDLFSDNESENSSTAERNERKRKFISVSIEQAEASSTDDDSLQIDPHSDNKSEKSSNAETDERERKSICKNTSVASVSIEEVDTSSTDDCLQIDLQSDDNSENSNKGEIHYSDVTSEDDSPMLID